VAVGREPRGDGQDLLPLVEVGVDGVELLLDLVGFAGDAGLFGLEQLEGDGVVVVGVEQLVAFAVERGQPCGVPLVVVDGALLTGGDLGAQGVFDAGDDVGGQLDALVETV
jgi:hypothetical protein